LKEKEESSLIGLIKQLGKLCLDKQSAEALSKMIDDPNRSQLLLCDEKVNDIAVLKITVE
jgi:hypothetical protein